MSIIERFQKSRQMSHCRADHKHMEDLMRAAPDIELPRVQTLRHPCRVDTRAENIQGALKKKPAEADLLLHAVDPEYLHAVQDREDGRQAHPDKHGRTEGSPAWGPELWEYRNADTAETDGADHRPVAVLEFRGAVEPVEDAGDKTSHDEADNADIIERVANAGHNG